MLSILIPIYNFDIREFVTSLHAQALLCKIEFEIICMDDASSPAYKETNREVMGLKEIIYKELPENIGRAKIRNLLASSARFESLLFLDCDSKLIKPDFIAEYIKYKSHNTILCGGTHYDPNPPPDPSKHLRWFYGLHREMIPAVVRQKNVYKSFTPNNVMMPKELFLKLKFNENIVGYGHEDTLFGFKLKELKIQVHHIDNPLCHIGLEPSLVFIDKTEQALKNLKFILSENIPIEDVRILHYYKLIGALKLNFLVRFIFKKVRKKIFKNLLGRQPSLLVFDVYKLGYLTSL
jgi:glycosyltransferase involved in cell wall biosynthesis